MNRLIALGALVLALSIPAAAQANVQVLSAEGDAAGVLQERRVQEGLEEAPVVHRRWPRAAAGSCGSTSSTGSPTEKNIVYGSDGDVDFHVTGPGGSFTNLNRPPDAPPGGGAVKFNGSRKRMAIGFTAAFNGSFSQTVGIGGALTCKYPPKKKKKR